MPLPPSLLPLTRKIPNLGVPPVPFLHSRIASPGRYTRKEGWQPGVPGSVAPPPGSPDSTTRIDLSSGRRVPGVTGPLPGSPAASALHVFGGGPENRRVPEARRATLAAGGGRGPAGRAPLSAGRGGPETQSRAGGAGPGGRGGAWCWGLAVSHPRRRPGCPRETLDESNPAVACNES